MPAEFRLAKWRPTESQTRPDTQTSISCGGWAGAVMWRAGAVGIAVYMTASVTCDWSGAMVQKPLVKCWKRQKSKGRTNRLTDCKYKRQLKASLGYPIFIIFQENLYKTQIWLVEHAQMILYELPSYWVSTYRISLTSYQKCQSYSNIKFGCSFIQDTSPSIE